MAGIEKIREVMQHNEEKKKSLRKSILMLMFEWKNFEENSDINTSCLRECFNELEAKEKHLTSVEESVKAKEEEFCAFREREIKELECQWKEFDLARKGFDEVVKLREEKLKEQQKLVEHVCKETEYLEDLQKSVDNRFREISMKEEEFEQRSKEVNKIQIWIRNETDDLHLKERKFMERVEEFEVKEKRLHLMEKEVEIKERGLDSVTKELIIKENCLDTVKKELRVKEAMLASVKKKLREEAHNLESIQKELRRKEDRLSSAMKELRIKEDRLSSVKKELELKDKNVDSTRKKLEVQEQELTSFKERLQLREGELDSIQKAYWQQLEEVDSRGKKLDSMQKCDAEFQLEKENFQKEQGLFKKRMEDIALKEKQIEVRCGELIQREKYIDERFKLLEKEKQLKTISSSPVKTEPLDYVEVERVGAVPSGSADIRFVITMDGKSLQIYLNEHEKELDSMSDQVFKALRLSPNPGQLVLDAMEGFYSPHLRKGDTEFKASVARKSCILILEQLTRFAPKIQPIVQEAATKLAREWKVKMSRNNLEILGFLYLLASYNLVPAFDADELTSLLSIVEHSKYKDLCWLLGFTDKLSPTPPHETQLKQIMASTCPSDDTKEALPSSISEASTCKCHISDAFSVILMHMGGKNLISFLKGHWEEHELLRYEVSRALKISTDSRMLVLEALGDFYPHNEEIESCNPDIIRKCCILLLEELMRISPLLKPEAKLKASKLASKWKAKMMAEPENYLAILGFLLLAGAYGLASTFDKNELERLCSTVAQHGQIVTQIRHALGISVICGEPDSKNVERKSTQIKECIFHSSSDPAKFVLDALRKCYSSEQYKSEYVVTKKRKRSKQRIPPLVLKRSPELLEQLRNTSPKISPQVKIEAAKFAVEWRATLTESWEVLGFFNLLATFELCSWFDSYDLLGLLKMVDNIKQAVNAIKILGLGDKIPLFIEDLIGRREWLKAITYICEFELFGSFPPVPLLKKYVSCAMEQARQMHRNEGCSRKARKKAINCELYALRTAVKCIVLHNLQTEYSPDRLSARISELEREMANSNVPAQPISQVQKAVKKQQKKQKTERRHQQPMQPNRFDATGNCIGSNEHCTDSGVSLPFLPYANPFYHHQIPGVPSYFS